MLLQAISATRVIIRENEVASEYYNNMQWTVEEGNAYWAGAAIHIEKPSTPELVNVISCKFIGVYNGGAQVQNRVQGGGAVYFQDVDCYLLQCTFDQCVTRSGRGGGVLCYENCQAQIYSSVFRSCSCEPQYHLDIGGGGAIAMKQDSLTMTGTYFYDCTCPNHGGGAICLGFGDKPCPGVTVRACHFEGCTAKGPGVFEIGEAGVTECVSQSNPFVECSSQTSSAILDYESGQKVWVIYCNVTECTGASHKALFNILAVSPAFQENIINVSLGEDTYCAIVLGRTDKTEQLLFYRCKFMNNDQMLGEEIIGPVQRFGGGFINVSDDHQEVVFHECEFSHISKKGYGAGLNIELKTPGVLTCQYCNFTNLHCTESGAAFVSGWGYDTFERSRIVGQCSLVECRIESCWTSEESVRGGAGIYLGECICGATIWNCTFINNSSPGKSSASSIYFYCDSSRLGNYNAFEKIKIVGCQFENHTQAAIGVVPWDQSAAIDPLVEFILYNLTFVNNDFSESNAGAFDLPLTALTLSACRFSSNIGPQGIICISPKMSKSLSLIGCVFENCVTKSAGLLSLSDTIGQIIITSLAVNDCISENSACFLDSTLCMNIGMGGAFFTNCQGASGKGILSGSFYGLILFGCSFTGGPGTYLNVVGVITQFTTVLIEAPRDPELPHISLEITDTGLIENLVMTTLEGSTPISSMGRALELSCGSGATVSMTTCCFNSNEEVHSQSAAGHYVKLSATGTVTLADMCFDTNESLALEVSGNVVFDGDKESFFVHCFCSAITPTPDPTALPLPTETPEPQTGKKSNAGMIAGIVIALLIVIAALVLLLFFFVIRRRKQNTSSKEEEPTYEDQPEETITTINDNDLNGEWGTVTEENAIFAAPSQDQVDSPFGQAFEEKQFY